MSRRATRSTADANPVGTTLWVIDPGEDGCPEERECPHPTADLDEMGDDGINGYYECGRCGSTLVFGEQIVLQGRGLDER